MFCVGEAPGAPGYAQHPHERGDQTCVSVLGEEEGAWHRMARQIGKRHRGHGQDMTIKAGSHTGRQRVSGRSLKTHQDWTHHRSHSQMNSAQMNAPSSTCCHTWNTRNHNKSFLDMCDKIFLLCCQCLKVFFKLFLASPENINNMFTFEVRDRVNVHKHAYHWISC